MENIIISTEATCDLDKEYVNKNNVMVCEYHYIFEDKECSSLDGKEKEVFSKMRQDVYPQTSQVNYTEAYEHLKKCMDTGKNVLHLGFSSALSGTFNNFKQAQSELKGYTNKLVVVDSLTGSVGLGLLVYMVTEKAKEDISFDDLVNYANELVPNIVSRFVVGDTKYLVHGGRANKLVAFIGKMLHIEPILGTEENGKIVIKQKVMGQKNVFVKLVNYIKETVNTAIKTIFISHADNEKRAEQLSMSIEKEIGIKPNIFDIGVVMGAHCGPDTVAVFYIKK